MAASIAIVRYAFGSNPKMGGKIFAIHKMNAATLSLIRTMSVQLIFFVSLFSQGKSFMLVFCFCSILVFWFIFWILCIFLNW